MFIVKNLANKRTIKNAIDRQPFTFETREIAKRFADNIVSMAIACDKRAPILMVEEVPVDKA